MVPLDGDPGAAYGVRMRALPMPFVQAPSPRRKFALVGVPVPSLATAMTPAVTAEALMAMAVLLAAVTRPLAFTVKVATYVADPQGPVFALTVARVCAPEAATDKSPEAATDTH